MDQWLVRTSQNWIAGPYSKQQVIQMLKEEKLTLQDEVCRANHYWFFLHEKEEVLAQIGIEFPFLNSGDADNEITETQTESFRTDRTDPHLDLEGMEAKLLRESGGEITAVFSPAGLQASKAQKTEVSKRVSSALGLKPDLRRPQLEVKGVGTRKGEETKTFGKMSGMIGALVILGSIWILIQMIREL
jgi:hypothetical protein